MPLVFHSGHLSPFVVADLIFLHGTESLLSGEATKYVNVSFANCNGVCISALIHWCLVSYLVLHCKVEASVLLGG